MRLRMLCISAAAVVLALGSVPRGAAGGPKGGGHGHGKPRATCDDITSCTFGAALEDSCPCDDPATHGQYVRCVARAAKSMAAGGLLDRRCRGRVVSLAAHSACGRANGVACLFATSTCDDEGSCVDDPSIDCVDDTDCGSRCVVTSADKCDSANGVYADVGICAFASCSPSGAFLDPNL